MSKKKKIKEPNIMEFFSSRNSDLFFKGDDKSIEKLWDKATKQKKSSKKIIA